MAKRKSASRKPQFTDWQPQTEMEGAPQVEADGGDDLGEDSDNAYAEDLQQLLDVQKRLIEKLHVDEPTVAYTAQMRGSGQAGADNVVGVDIGMEMKGGAFTGRLATRVLVVEKLSEELIEDEFLVHSEEVGGPTDVVEVGPIEALSVDYKQRYSRPVPCGSSISLTRRNDGTGTLGCLVATTDNKLCVLSNNHVIGRNNDAVHNEWVIQPGTADRRFSPNRFQEDVMGEVERIIPINFSGLNRVDAAIAQTGPSWVSPAHHVFRIDTRTLSPAASLMRSVKKCGRTTGFTVGTVTGTNARIRVGFPGGRSAAFEGQLTIQGMNGAFSTGGDSGSLVVDASTNRPVGLLFAGGTSQQFGRVIPVTFANPIDWVLRALNVTLVNQI